MKSCGKTRVDQGNTKNRGKKFKMKTEKVETPPEPPPRRNPSLSHEVR